MSFEVLHNSLRTRFNTEVPGLKIQWPNAYFADPGDAQWVRFGIENTLSNGSSFGFTPKYRVRGHLVIETYTPLFRGDQEALALADTVASLFRTRLEDGVRYQTPSIQAVGRDQRHPTFYRVDVQLFYLADVAFVRATGASAPIDSFEELKNAVRTRFKTQVIDIYDPSLQVAWDNSYFIPPDSTTRWVRMSVGTGSTFQVVPGGQNTRSYRTPGIVFAQIFVPVFQGTKGGLELADVIGAAYQGGDIGGVVYGVPIVKLVGRPQHIGTAEDAVGESYYQINVQIPFSFDNRPPPLLADGPTADSSAFTADSTVLTADSY